MGYKKSKYDEGPRSPIYTNGNALSTRAWGMNGDLINFTTTKQHSAHILTQSRCEMNVYNASNSLALEFDTTPSCLYSPR